MLPLVIQIEKTKERTAETCAFAQSPVRIGRNPLNDVELDDGYVSQWHGVIRFDEKHTTYLDLGSTNPTVIDGKPIERNVEVPIGEGTDLRIGSFRLHVIRVDAPPELFGARRKTAFARTGVGDASSVAATMFFGGEPTKLRSKSQMHDLFAAARAAGSLSGPPPVPAYSAHSQPPPATPSAPPPRQPPVVVSQPPVFSQQMQPILQPSVVVSHPPPAYPAAERSTGGAQPGAAGDSLRPGQRGSGSPPPLPAKGGGLAAMSSASLRAASIAPTVASPQQQQPAPARPSRHDSQPVPAGSSQDSLRAAYENYRSAWRALLAELRYRLERAASGRRSDVLDQLVQDYPDIGREAEFRTLISELGISPLRTGVPEMEDWLRRLTDNMFPPPNAGINVALAMERIGEVLEVFATAFVEMRDAHGRFCDEMSLEKPPNDSILQTTKNPRLALAYLLNPSAEGAGKVEELARSMADFALHQVALVSAVVEGARGVLQELSPDAIEPKDKRKKKSGFFGGMFSNEAQLRWQRYRSQFTELMDEDRFTRKLFARPFARKYYAIMGGRRSFTPTG
jgi:predicted component of type VI protein secretion system